MIPEMFMFQVSVPAAELQKDFATVKYSPDGILIWSMRYNGSGNGDDIAFGLSYDIQENIYVAGRSYDASSFDDFVTLKYSTVSEFSK